ncbi:unnamed protein product [Ilex paraguariensis]|uniref:Uncharacterized protein n=1 Tax=Ilex paraguariensis TaxID=185542 RepID=A0ABC8RDX1_9AQUA
MLACLIGIIGTPNIRIVSRENPKADDQMIQIAGDMASLGCSFTSDLAAEGFDRGDAISTYVSILPYLPMPMNESISKEFTIRLFFHTTNIGDVIGGRTIIQILRESRANIKIGSRLGFVVVQDLRVLGILVLCYGLLIEGKRQCYVGEYGMGGKGWWW